MKTIRNLRDLEQYGVNALTGEACGYNYRTLCDLTPAGVKLVKDVLGIIELQLPSNWNSKGVASIMLPHAMFEPLAIFALFGSGCSKVFVTYDGIVYGVESKDTDEQLADFIRWNQGTFCEDCARYGKGGGINRQYVNSGHARNQHAMSGRTS